MQPPGLLFSSRDVFVWSLFWIVDPRAITDIPRQFLQKKIKIALLAYYTIYFFYESVRVKNDWPWFLFAVSLNSSCGIRLLDWPYDKHWTWGRGCSKFVFCRLVYSHRHFYEQVIWDDLCYVTLSSIELQHNFLRPARCPRDSKNHPRDFYINLFDDRLGSSVLKIIHDQVSKLYYESARQA